MSKKLKQAIISMWFEGSDPLIDRPDEIGGVFQTTNGKPDKEKTIEFASKMLDIHFNGECACQDV